MSPSLSPPAPKNQGCLRGTEHHILELNAKHHILGYVKPCRGKREPWICAGRERRKMGTKCALGLFPDFPGRGLCLPRAGEFLALHELVSLVRLCWSRLWKHPARSAQCQPFRTPRCFFQAQFNKGGKSCPRAAHGARRRHIFPHKCCHL